MPTAEELINSTVAYADSPEAEPHIIIGLDRYITVPDKLKKIAVQNDHNIETVTFDCPRFWDENDLSQMKIYINYENGETEGSYIAKNIKVGNDIIHFDWTISRNVTKYSGPVTFLVCAKKTDDDGEELLHWNSERNTDMYVSQGMECDKYTESVVNQYPDLVTQLLERMDGVENNNANTIDYLKLKDTVTGKIYTICVSNGKLTMDEFSGEEPPSKSPTNLYLVDTTTSENYKLYISNKKLTMEVIE